MALKEGTVHGFIDGKKNPPATSVKEEYIKRNIEEIVEIGTPEGSANYPLGWAQACNTPFKFWKQDANAEGGTHNPLIVFYPNGIKDKGTVRTQYGHIIQCRLVK